MNAPQSRDPWPTYTAYVDALTRVDSNFQWLSYFFNKDRQSGPSREHLNILESNDGIIEDHACSLDKIASPPKSGRTRIVVLSYDQVWSIDRQVLDRIAMSLNLPPYFLWQHLEYEGNRGEDAWPGDLGQSSPLRPHHAAASRMQSLEVGWTPFFHMSGLISSPATPSAGAIVMIFVRNRGFRLDLSRSAYMPGPANFSPSSLSDFRPPEEFWASLCTMSSTDIMAADQTPLDFFCPWICSIGVKIATHLVEVEETLGPFVNIKDFDEERLEKVISDIELNQLMLHQNISNLTSYSSFHPDFETPAMTRTLSELQILQFKAEALHKRGQALMNRLVGTLALKESRRSIQQSTSTKRLSQLAYIFLPLSLSTSIFGMNVIEVQNTQLRAFYATAVTALASSLFLWLCLGWLSRPAFRDNVIGISKAIFILIKFSQQAPAHATILIFYALSHSTLNTRMLLLQLGLWDIIWFEKAPTPTGISLKALAHQTKFGSKFWYKKVAGVDDFIKTSEWQKRYLLRKKEVQSNKDV